MKAKIGTTVIKSQNIGNFTITTQEELDAYNSGELEKQWREEEDQWQRSKLRERIELFKQGLMNIDEFFPLI